MNNLYRKLIDLLPDHNTKYEFIIRGSDGKVIGYRIFHWLLNNSSEKRDLIFSNSGSFNKELKKIFGVQMSSQIYYDVLMLNILSIEERPKCIICGKENKFISPARGYSVTCSKECHSELKRKQIKNNSKMFKQGDSVPEEIKSKISTSLKGHIFSDSWRQKHSDFMYNFAKTEKGKAFYKKVGEKTSIANIERLKSSDGSSYFSNKNFNRGRYVSEYFGGKIFNYDSGWELKFIKYFENDSIKEIVNVFDRCLDHVNYKWDDGSIHRYLPDFFIKFNSGTRAVIEIKPQYLLETDRKVQLSVEAGKKYFNEKGINYFIITEKELLSGNKIKRTFNIKDYDKQICTNSTTISKS